MILFHLVRASERKPTSSSTFDCEHLSVACSSSGAKHSFTMPTDIPSAYPWLVTEWFYSKDSVLKAFDLSFFRIKKNALTVFIMQQGFCLVSCDSHLEDEGTKEIKLLTIPVKT